MSSNRNLIFATDIKPIIDPILNIVTHEPILKLTDISVENPIPDIVHVLCRNKLLLFFFFCKKYVGHSII